MNKNYFEVICNFIIESERMKKFDSKMQDSNTCVLNAEDICYEIKYDAVQKQVKLGVCKAEGEDYKMLSTWMLDGENSSQKDSEMIAKDFIETMVGTDKNVVRQHQARAKNNEDESNVTGMFFANRMANVFPELKQAVQIEKECYSEFRLAKFTRENITPKINELLAEGKDKSKLGKLFKLLGELYQNGNMDVRSVITMVVLNGIEGEHSVDLAKELITPELTKIWDAASKFKGKTVKPEKPKKQGAFMTKMLEAQK